LFQTTYYVDKTSNTFADNLAAFGLAFVLNSVAAGRAVVRLEDQGSTFAVICEPALREEWVDECEFFVGAPFLITYDNRTKTKMVKGAPYTPSDLEGMSAEVAVDYQAEKENNTVYFAWLQALSAEDRRKTMRGGLRQGDGAPVGPQAPHRDWDLFRAVNPSALQSYNALVGEWWNGKVAFPELLKTLLQMTAQTPNDFEGAEKTWTKACKDHGLSKPKVVTASQLLNPAQGKGVNNTKAEWRAPGNVKNIWLLEWLKIVGLRNGGITRLIRNTKDRKTYALTPRRLEWGEHTDIMAKFQRAMIGSAGAVQLDIFAVLRYTQALLEHFEGAREEDLAAELFGHSANDLVSGMQTAYYKSLGNAIATMNMASINLPGWVKPRSKGDLARLHEVLDEHLAIVRNLDETRGDQFELLCHYRDFLSSNTLTPFFRFTTAYSSFIIRQYERRKYVRPFTTTTMEVLFMNSDDTQRTYSQIVQNEGFKNVAYAIRYSTVVPQGRKTRGLKPAVSIRYGLGQQLARKSAYPAEFLTELAEFIHLYNAENAQLRESKREPFRKNLTTADIDAVTTLVDRFGSKVVCNMLVAYGYAREPYEAETDQPREDELVDADRAGQAGDEDDGAEGAESDEE
jgi:hypothetical protein